MRRLHEEPIEARDAEQPEAEVGVVEAARGAEDDVVLAEVEVAFRSPVFFGETVMVTLTGKL